MMAEYFLQNRYANQNLQAHDDPLVEFSINKFLQHPTLYYPGSGIDFEPLLLFSENSPIQSFVHTDYIMAKGEVEQAIRSMARNHGYQVQLLEEVAPSRVKAKATSWEDFWYPNSRAKGFSNSDNAFGLWVLLQSANKHQPIGKLIELLHLSTEAIGTYEVLWTHRKPCRSPCAVVLQDHGFGCNWNKFGEGGLLYQSAKVKKPELLYVADNTNCWPRYRQVSSYSRYTEMPGASGRNRAIFMRLGASR